MKLELLAITVAAKSTSVPNAMQRMKDLDPVSWKRHCYASFRVDNKINLAEIGARGIYASLGIMTASLERWELFCVSIKESDSDFLQDTAKQAVDTFERSGIFLFNAYTRNSTLRGYAFK